jgi:hypothetical protein
MPSFVVDSYKVRLEISRIGNNPVVTTRTRVLELNSTIEAHGIVEQAVLVFSTSFETWSTTAVAGYLDSSNPLQPRLTGWFPTADFSLWYDVVRSEKPLTLFYTLSPIGGATYVNDIWLGTSSEPIGEGPVDLSP